MNDPIVSVFMITFNHEKYISESIEGVLNQKSDFSTFLIIGEDNSRDRTREICESYANTYPGKVLLLPKTENLGMQINAIRTFAACKGDFIAFCEGDDVWTYPYKLQMQVDFLKSNYDYNICTHEVIVLNEGNNTESKFSKKYVDKLGNKDFYNLEDYLLNGCIFHTSSFLFRNIYKGVVLPDLFKAVMSFDQAIFILHALDKKIKYMDYPMSTYRLHSGGITQETAHKSVTIAGQNMVKALEQLDEYTKYEFHDLLVKRIKRIKFKLLEKKLGIISIKTKILSTVKSIRDNTNK